MDIDVLAAEFTKLKARVDAMAAMAGLSDPGALPLSDPASPANGVGPAAIAELTERLVALEERVEASIADAGEVKERLAIFEMNFGGVLERIRSELAQEATSGGQAGAGGVGHAGGGVGTGGGATPQAGSAGGQAAPPSGVSASPNIVSQSQGTQGGETDPSKQPGY